MNSYLKPSIKAETESLLLRLNKGWAVLLFLDLPLVGKELPVEAFRAEQGNIYYLLSCIIG